MSKMKCVVFDSYNETVFNQIQDFLAKNKQANIFQSPFFFRAYLQTNNIKPLYFVSYKGNKIVAVLLAYIVKEKMGPLSFFTSRCVVDGGPVIEDGNLEVN